MKLLPIIITFFISHYSTAQADYFEYYQQVNKAKLLAAENQNDEAARLYKTTFEKFPFRFARDCVNAVEISSVTPNDSATAYFMAAALKQGIPLAYFAQSPKLANFRATENWKELSDKAASFRQTYEASINPEIRDEINSMFAADQAIRKRFYHWSNYWQRPFLGAKWKRLNTQQVERMMQITEEYGFPGEKLIGIDLPEHHEKIEAHQFSAGMPIILFIHHYSQPNASFDSTLVEEVKKGNLNNEHFATICDYEAHFGKNRYPNFGYYGLRLWPKNMSKSAFDAQRKKIQLLTDAELKKLDSIVVITKFWKNLK